MLILTNLGYSGKIITQIRSRMDIVQNKIPKKIAIIHDAFIVKGGAERLALHLSNLFPEAPIYTSVYQPKTTFSELKTKQIITHPFSRWVKSEKLFKQLYPLWFLYYFNVKLTEYELILSSSTYLAKYIQTPKNGQHICYMHSPFRFLWKRNSYTNNSLPFNSPIIQIIDRIIPSLQKIDFKLTQPIDQVITNSQNMANFIQTVYHKNAVIIYPPVDIQQYNIQNPQNFYLCVGRLISYKNIDLAIQACNQLKRKLVIIGDGFERNKLEAIAGNTITFLGKVDEETLKSMYATCKALIFPGVEDFGMVPIEVQASGRPVIAYRSGGVLETVTENETGIFFDDQNIDSLIQAIISFENRRFDPSFIRNSVQRFDLSIFEESIKTSLQKYF
ncbi:MAG: glycosyltransferase family 4 protein [Chloroflexi bacterium HGW-Chloroflexi-10]|nr:MAG: glycosyltransferase family 4 protein [Chloroflexi bacterium HGW-Chloroflexi-10]